MQKEPVKEIKVSVIMPSLNVADYIEECVKSVLEQSLHEIEVICVDAGSVDGTYEILKQYAEEDDRIQLVSSNVKSYGKQVNIGLEIAKGEYIAVVETDDYVEPEMYETLYNMAKENNADYVKADFQSFFVLGDSQKVFQNVRVLGKHQELYNRLINPEQYLFLFENDYNIWTGIYKKEFLTKKGIRLNETVGAAFQDIGFTQQVLCWANRAIYTNKDFYRYRVDRDASSSYSPRVLMFAYQEFRWLFEKVALRERISPEQQKGIYRRMAQVFLFELKKLVKGQNDNGILAENSMYYRWFQTEVNEGLKTGILCAEDFAEDIWTELRLLIKNEMSFADYVAVKKAICYEMEQKLIETVKDKEIIIFGCGIYGMEAFRFFANYGVKIRAFCDNDQSKWGKYIGGIEISALNWCVKEYQDVYYVIANKNNQSQIRKQLIEANIEATKILKFNVLF